jgi:predicted ATPase with chaperone activity
MIILKFQKYIGTHCRTFLQRGGLFIDETPERAAMNFLHDELDRERVTARGLHKVRRISWTLADLSERKVPNLEDVKSAYMLREGSL